MKGYDAIKYLLDNPKEQLVNSQGHVMLIEENNYLLITNKSRKCSFATINIERLKDDWELEPQEITRDEAIQRLINNKSVKHDFGDEKVGLPTTKIYYDASSVVPVKRLTEGKWYAID